MRHERLYIVAYDIAEPKRWRRVFQLMKGYGEWVQLSVFQCRLSDQRHAELLQLLEGTISSQDDRLLVIDVGPADEVTPRFRTIGAPFDVMERGPIVV